SATLFTYFQSTSLHSFPTRRSSDLGKLLCFGLPHKLGMRGDVHAFRHFELGSRMEQMPHGKLVFTAEKRFLGSEQMEYGIPDKGDRKSTRLNSSHVKISYAVFCLKR